MTDPRDDFSAAREQLRLSLEADLIAGRGKLPRDRSGRVSSSFLEESRRELPEETAPRSPAANRNGFSGLSQILALVAPAAVLEEAPRPRDRVAQLEQLERDLAQLLESSAPAMWAQLRGPLRRLLNRARRELRAIDRSSPIT